MVPNQEPTDRSMKQNRESRYRPMYINEFNVSEVGKNSVTADITMM